MLPAAHRLRRREDFAATVRRGRRHGAPDLVIHQLTAEPDAPPRVGFVVARSVGGAVVRNRVRRQLQHVVASRLPSLAPGTTLVLRAHPSAAGRTSAELAGQVDRALVRGRSGAR
jgi:ribonuclease P protein component